MYNFMQINLETKETNIKKSRDQFERRNRGIKKLFKNITAPDGFSWEIYQTSKIK